MVPRPILLVHGAWHGAWCWSALQAELDRRGVASWAIDLPGHGLSTEPLADLYTDADAVLAAASAIGGDGVVLVGHSYGGGVITEAATRSLAKGIPIAHLVYLTAFAVDEGESVGGLAASLPAEDTPLGGMMVRHDDGTFSARSADAAADVFYGHCTAEQATGAFARLSHQTVASLRQPVTGNPRAHDPEHLRRVHGRPGDPPEPPAADGRTLRRGRRAGHRPLAVHVDAGRDGGHPHQDRRRMKDVS